MILKDLRKFMLSGKFFTILSLICCLYFLKLNARIVRSSCFTYANFSYVTANALLQGSVVASFGNKATDECKDECILNPQCKSINIHTSGSCQLNDKSAADPSDKSTLTLMQDWTFHSTDYAERKLGGYCQRYDPCGEEFLCTDSCDCPGYVCIPCALAPGLKCQEKFYIKHWSGLCLAYRKSNSRFYLAKSCNEKFILTSTKALKHIQSGKCAIPRHGGARVGLTADCSDINTRFEQTANFRMKHISTGKCVHPKGGSQNPAVGTDIVMAYNCDSHPRLEFKFIIVRE